MMNIIKADFFRLRKSKVLFGIIVGIVSILLFGNLLAMQGDGKMTLMSDTQGLNEVNYAIKGSKVMVELLKGSGVLMFFVLPIVLNVFISDFKFNTVKNIVGYKYSRKLIYFSKLILCSLLAIVLPMVYVVIGLILNLAFNQMAGAVNISDFVNVIQVILVQAPIYIGFVGVMLLIGILFQSGTVTIITTIVYQTAILLVVALFKTIDISSYEPVTCLDKAAYLASLGSNDVFQILLVGVVMIVASILCGSYLYERKDFK